MDRRQLIAAIVERTGIKLDHDDPAFILVELNRLTLEESAKKVADQIGQAAEKFNRVATSQVDDFVTIANEALSKFIQKTNEIKASIDSLPAPPSIQPTPIAIEKSDFLNKWGWWVLPGVFIAGTIVGASLSFFTL